MLHSYERRSHQSSYGLRRIYQLKPTAIRYPKPQVSNGQTTLQRSVIFPPPVPVKKFSFLEFILGLFAAFWCLNLDGTRRQPVNSGGGGGGGGSSSCGNGGGSSCGGGGCGGGGCGGGGCGGGCGGG